MRFLFIGEERSKRAKKLGVSLKDGRLAAKQLFDALLANDIPPTEQKFINIFETLKEQGIKAPSMKYAIVALKCNGYEPVAMGNKVERKLHKLGITHRKIVHPAALGNIRKKENYILHIKENLIDNYD